MNISQMALRKVDFSDKLRFSKYDTVLSLWSDPTPQELASIMHGSSPELLYLPFQQAVAVTWLGEVSLIPLAFCKKLTFKIEHEALAKAG